MDFPVTILRPNCPAIFAGGGGGGSLGAFRSSAITTFNGTGTCVANMPAGVLSGDYLVAYASSDGSGSTWTTIPAGWTQIDSGVITAEGDSWSVAVRVAGGGEPSTYTWGNNGTLDSGIIIGAWQNINAVTPRTFETPTTNNTLNASPMTIGATGGACALNDCIAYFVSADKSGPGSLLFTEPAGYVNRHNVTNGWISLGLFTLDNAPAGATGTINSTGTGTTAGWNTVVVALATA